MARAAVSLLIFIFYNTVKSPVNKIGVVYEFKCENVFADKKLGRAAGENGEGIGACRTVATAVPAVHSSLFRFPNAVCAALLTASECAE